MQHSRYLWRILLILSLFTIAKLGAQEQNKYYTLDEKLFSKIRTDTVQINQQLEYAHTIFKRDYKSDSVIILCKEALLKSIASGYADGAMRAASNLSFVYKRRGYYDISIQYLKRAFVYAQKDYRDHSMLASVYLDIGDLYYRKGIFDTAADYNYRALYEIEHYKITNYHYAIEVYNTVAGFWDNTGDTKKALYYLEKSENLIIKYGDTSKLATTILDKSNIYLNNKQWDSAMYYCQKAVVLSRKANNPIDICQSTMGVGIIYAYRDQPNLKKATLWLQEAVKLMKQAKDKVGYIRSYYHLGYAYYLQHDYKKAEKIMETVCLQTQTMGLKDNDLVEAYKYLADIYKRNGNYQKAFSELETYKQMEDSFLTKEKARTINQLDIKYRVAEKDKALSEKQLQLLKQQNNLKEKDFWIGGISAGTMLLTVLFISMFRSNQQKQRIGKLNAILQGEENERGRLARELHDGIGGMLASIQLNLGSVKEEYSALDIKRLDEVLYMLQDTSIEVRKTAHNLMPDVLTKHSLVEALVIYCENVNKGTHLEIDLQFTGDLKVLNKSIELVLYRIIQELIQNIIKHARASYAAIQIMQYEEKLSITVEDNGIGFDTHKNNGGYGLQNLQFRVQALYGKISIMSTEGKSTTVYVEFELQKLKKSVTV